MNREEWEAYRRDPHATFEHLLDDTFPEFRREVRFEPGYNYLHETGPLWSAS